MKTETIIAIVVLVVVALGLGVIFSTPDKQTRNIPGVDLSSLGREEYHEIEDPAGFVNTPSTSSEQVTPITIGEFVGKKVILIDFLTYSCINCQRTFPYVNAWYEKYKDHGLVVIGIHTPEFAFEKDIDNVREAMKKFGIKHPIVLDNEYATWRAYDNNYWPRKYLIDIHGNIVYDHIGEGAYEETEKAIQKALAERARVLGEQADLGESLAIAGIEQEKVQTASPETYFGYARNEFLGNGTPGSGGLATFKLPETLAPNKLYLEGEWQLEREYVETRGETRVLYRYAAKNVYLVTESSLGTTVEVWQDGKFVKNLEIKASQLYNLVENTQAGEHVLELRIRDKGVRFYAFTFG